MFKLNTALHSFDLNLESLADLDFVKNEDGSFFFVHNEQVYTLRVLNIDGKKLTISVNGKSIEYTIADELDLLVDKLGFSVAETERIDEIKAPMPGLVLKIMVSNDEEVKEGQALLILEAMKMENVIKAPADGQIKHIDVKVGEAVEKKKVLLTFY